jgi:hypothetical protein
MGKARNNVTLAPVPPVENVVNLVTPVETPVLETPVLETPVLETPVLETAPYPALLPAVETAPKVKLLPVPAYNDNTVITGILNPIPKLPGSGAWDRYACYFDGITAGEYIKRCPQKKGRACIKWDFERGLISFK